MKICQFYEDFVAPAKDSMGAERVCESITKGLLELGHEVVLKINPASKTTIAPIVTEVPDDVDIIHFHQWQPGKIDYDKWGKPWIVTLHGGGSETDPALIRATKKNPHIVCVSEHIAKIFDLNAWVWACSNPDDFLFQKNKEDYFLWMAGTDWGEGKGLWSTIFLAKQLGIKLILAGSGRNVEIIDRIKSMCDDKIKYVGSVNGTEKANLLSKSKALILLTKLNDACPTTVSEALLSGTPVIASTNGAMPELIEHGKTGFLCKANSDVVKAIATISKIDPEICKQSGMERYTHIVAAKKYLQYYQNMLDFKTVSL